MAKSLRSNANLLLGRATKSPEFYLLRNPQNYSPLRKEALKGIENELLQAVDTEFPYRGALSSNLGGNGLGSTILLVLADP